MRSRLRITLCSCAAALILGCTKSEDAPPQFNKPLGSVAALPTPSAVTDPGILQNPAEYRPAMGGKGAAASGDERAQVQALAEELVKAGIEGDIETVMNAFDPAHIAALKEQESVLYETAEKNKSLEASLTSKIGEDALIQYKDGMRQLLMGNLDVQVQDAEHATITPNIVTGILGPKAQATLTVAKVGGEWKIQLPAPLTAADAAQIVQYHRNVQTAIEPVVDQLEAGQLKDMTQVMTAIASAMQGKAAPTSAPTEDEGAVQPAGGGPTPALGEGGEAKPEGETSGEGETPKKPDPRRPRDPRRGPEQEEEPPP